MAEVDLAKTSKRVLKVVVVGPTGVGKSALVQAWKECQPPSSPQPTDGAETRATEGNTPYEAELQFCELGDEASEKEAADNFADADVVVLVYDCQRPLETVAILRRTWLRRVKQRLGTHAGFLLIANKAKVDLDSDTFLEYSADEDALFEALPIKRRERMRFLGLDNVRQNALQMRAIVYYLAYAGRCFTLSDDQPGRLKRKRYSRTT